MSLNALMVLSFLLACKSGKPHPLALSWLGLLVVLLYPHATHVALDNAAVVQVANHILEQLHHDNHLITDGYLAKSNNGDLWKIFRDCVLSKGVDAVLVSKTKGHALEDA
eukprot:509879-Karenia_brevis.AAC.1